MTAADVLRERAAQCEAFHAANRAKDAYLSGQALRTAAELRALADLVEACVDIEPGRFQCRVCRSVGRSEIYSAVRVHTNDCPLAAVERAFAKEKV